MKRKNRSTLAFFGLVMLSLMFVTALLASAMTSPSGFAGSLVAVAMAAVIIGGSMRTLNQVGAVKVRVKNPDSVTYAHASATVKDTVYLINGIPMLAVNSADANAVNVFLTIAVIEYAKLSAQAWTGGVKIYWDDGNSRFTTASSGNTLAGIAEAAAANPSSTGMVFLCPFLVGTNQLENAIADPGTGVAIPVTASGNIAITIGSAGAETNTLAAPSRVGMQLSLTADVVGTGTRVVTCATTVNQTGNNTLTFAQAADTIKLHAVQIGGALRWRVSANDGVALSTV